MAGRFKPAHLAVLERGIADPLALAITEADGQTLSCADLCRRALCLAASLASHGISCEDIVAVELGRSTDAIAAMIGILAAGACYLPIAPGTRGRRLAELLERSNTRCIIINEFETEIPAAVLQLRPSEWNNSPLPVETVCDIRPHQLAYLIFTSGSTGLPKGVAMSHRGLSRLIDWQCRDGPVGLRTLAFAALGFDVSLQEVLSTLASGGRLILCEERTRQDPAELLEVLRQQKIERIFVPPGALHRLASVSVRLDKFPADLVHVVAAGEPLVITEAVVEFFRRLPGARLDNHYGPTEAHLVTALQLSGDPQHWPAMPPIGAAVDGMTARVLDREFSEAEPGKLGELYIGGTGIARGYFRDPRGTAERFLPDPHGRGAIMYRSGDLAYRSETRVLNFAGRADDQIKIRGFRVEPGQVECMLCALPGVEEAAVGVREITDGVSLLVAYIVANQAKPKPRELAAALAERLPEFMIPARFVFVSALPLAESGKIDRSALATLPLETAAAAPLDQLRELTPIELVREIWLRVLGHEDFGNDEDFFDVGGDSLLAIWVINELSRAIGSEISLSVFLDAATVEGLASVLSDRNTRFSCARRSGELVTLRAGPPGRLLFMFHPLGGEVLAYRDFARALNTPVRVLGMRMTPGWIDSQFTLEELAAAHVEEIVALEPAGPYRLAGWSFGGRLAYEVAQQLRRRGERIDFLGLIDANPSIDPLAGEPSQNSRYVRELDQILGSVQAGEPVEFRADTSFIQLLGGVPPEGLSPSQLAGYLATTRANLAAAGIYSPSAFDGRIDLFQAGDTDVDLQHQLVGALHGLARGGLTVHMIGAGHFSMLHQPAVEELARLFDTALQESLSREELVS